MWSSIWATKYFSTGSNSTMRSSSGWSMPSRMMCTNSKNCSMSSSGKPSMPRMTLGGMYCAYFVPALTTSSPASPSSSFEQSSRIIGSSALIGAGAKAGRISRRAIAWNGGSDVMGGAPPIGAGQVQFRRATVAHDDGATREVVGVLGDLGDAGVRRGEPGAAVAIGVGDRAALAEVLPDRIGIGDPLRIGVIEVGGEVLDEWAVGHDYSSMKIACSGQFAWASRASSRVSLVERAVADDDAVAEIIEVEDRRARWRNIAPDLDRSRGQFELSRVPLFPTGTDLTTQ